MCTSSMLEEHADGIILSYGVLVYLFFFFFLFLWLMMWLSCDSIEDENVDEITEKNQI